MSGRRVNRFWLSGVRRRVAGVTAVVVVASALAAPQAVAAPVGTAAEPDVGLRSVPVAEQATAAADTPSLPEFEPREPVWPEAVSQEVDVPAETFTPVGESGFAVGPGPADGGDSAGRSALTAGSASVSRVSVEVLDQSVAEAAGVPGVLFRVVRADGGLSPGQVGVQVDTSGFAGAFGGDWAARLGVVAFPDCVLTSPDAAGCAVGERLLSSRLDSRTGVLSAVVDAGVAGSGERLAGRGEFPGFGESAEVETSVVLAVAGVQSGETGDYTKTPMSSSFEWASGGSSGDFTWSYDMAVPPAPGGLVPQVGLGYSSGAVDGQTAGRNVQPGPIGEGWDLRAGGYIERAYRPCSDDLENSPYHTQANGDLCWRLPNLRLVWGGKSTELVQDPGDGRWRLGDDDGEMVQQLSGANNGDQGDGSSDTGEYWRLTTNDGTQYYFGLATVPGGRSTNSTAITRVRANHSGEPCFSTGDFRTSSCWQAWRWNLAYVVDVHGNAMAYFYEKEWQRSGYGWNGYQTYDRATRLVGIEYGVTASTGFGGPAPAAVEFVWSDRCLSSCGSSSSPNTANWPDTPWDLYCSSSASSCPSNPAPSFWSSKRLTAVKTSVRTGPGTNRLVVDQWALEQLFPATGNTTSPALWLQSITRTGSAKTPAVTLPEIRFGGTLRDQRADFDPNSGMVQPRKYRVAQVFTETGGRIDVTYLGQDSGCQFGGTFPDPDNNNHRCYPKYWKPEDNSAGFGWWHKYIVVKVTETDLVGGSPPVVHDYQYTLASASGSAQVLWGHENGAATFTSSLPYRSWSDWRGYTDVTTTVGPSGGTRSQTKRLYLRGLQNDWTDTGEDRFSRVTNSLGEAVVDHSWRRGYLAEEISYDGVGGQPIAKTIYSIHGSATGVRTYSSDWAIPTVHQSVISRVGLQRDFTWVTGTQSWRQTRTEKKWHPNHGYLTELNDLGDPDTTADDRCGRTWYSNNISANLHLVGVVNRTQVARAACTVAPVQELVVSETRMFHDGATVFGTAAVRGDVTRVEQLASYTGTTPNWVKTATASYDTLGRTISSGDALDRITTTTYTHNNNDLLGAVTTTNPAGHSSTVNLDTTRGLPTTAVDANGKTTTVWQDALGRLTHVWAPGRTTSQTPDTEYAYTVSLTAPATVETKTLGPSGNVITSFDIADGLLRPRQTQVTAPDGKRTISDTQYDDRGLATKTSTFYNDASGPTGSLVTFADTAIESQTRTVYDGAGRPTRTQLWSANTLQWETVTGYGGDRVTVDPPTGGTPTTSIIDRRGRQTALRQHTGSSPTGAYEETSYGYNPRDELTTVTDPAGNQWTYTYDLLGRRTGTVDPDAGTSSSTYDNADQLVTTTDGRGETLWHGYDNLGRPTELRDDTSTGALRASWTYDTLELGLPTSSTRHHGGDAYTTAVTGYDDGYRPLGATVTIPAAETGLAGTYTTSHTYHDNGTPATTSLPAIGGLPAETLTYGYHTASGLPTTLTTGTDTFVSATSYHYDGSIAQRILGTGGTRIRVSSPVETATRRLAASQVDTEHPTTPDTWNDAATTSYTYDPAGNVTSMAGTTAGVADQAEYFTYDHLRRLTQAWTETTPTCTTPQRTGADPYRQAFTYDTTGNRLTATTWTATGSTTATSTYPTPGSPQPHTVTAVDHTGETTRTDTYAYTTGGHTQTRTVDGVTQTLTWDAEGRLATTTEPGLNTTNIYDTSGNRLIRRDTTGTTLYLGHTELRRTTSNGQIDGTRHYQHAGATIAVRTVTGLTWLIPDHHGTNQITIDPTTLNLTRRRTLPFGDTRGTLPTAWPDDKGFVGGTQDPTSLTHIGARHYDPALGRFISVDPIMDPADPQQMHGYAYANNNPTTWSDPTGLRVCADNDCGQGATPKPGGGYNKPTGKPSCSPNCGERKPPTTGGAPKSPKTGGPDKVANGAAAGGTKTKGDESPGSGANSDDGFTGSSLGVFQGRWCLIMGPISCLRGVVIQQKAIDAANTFGDRYGWSVGRRNAFRHSYWMGLMTLSGFTYSDTVALGLAHEKDTDKPGELLGSPDSNADLHNNSVGARVGVDVRPWYVAATGVGATAEHEKALEERLMLMVGGDARGRGPGAPEEGSGPYTMGHTRDGWLVIVDP
ncbi:RHS repeat domain-containing protein [Solwaraspora sp. WMMB762]|uniref:RHS repeat domain-containing protein n=1 Tax=Solwaraspora sp. WMMB762 TaxID=3404120 RepID=UPI003B95BEFF